MDYRKFLPEPPDDCGDPELFRLLNEFHFVAWHPDHTDRRDALWQEISTEPMLSRAEAAIVDPYERLRHYAGQILLLVRQDGAAPFALKLLQDESDFVRGEIARTFARIRCEEFLTALVNLAKSDHSAFVRGCAATGLGGQDPVKAIPVLIDLLDNDHQACDTGHTPGDCAATALDEMMETEWTQKRYSEGFRGLNTESDYASLREQVLVFLEHCQTSQ